MKNPAKQKNISQLFSKSLLTCVVIAFIVTTAFIYILQTEMSADSTDRLLRLNISDVRQDIIDASDENLLKLAHQIAEDIRKSDIAYVRPVSSEYLTELTEQYGVTEINYINSAGIITASTNADFLQYDMRNGEQSAEFMALLSTKSEFVQGYQPVSYDASISRKYAGVVLGRGGFVQVGYDAKRFQQDIDEVVVGVTRNRHVGENGCLIVCDENWRIVSDRNNYEGRKLSDTGLQIDPETMPENTSFSATAYGKASYCMYAVSEGYYVIAILPKSEAVLTRNVSVSVTLLMELAVFAALFIVIYFLLKRQIVDNVQKMNQSLEEITGGNLDVVVDVHSNSEFSALSDDINTTVDALKHHIDEAAARIDQELEYAKSIQLSALPSVFPPYPNQTAFSIYAQMDTAKEVGGDFYDFYLLSENTLGFLIADVSGKGIPAAMFMMKAKTIIQNLAESGADPAKVFKLANNKLCEGNDTMMFVTAWLGFLDLKTGALTYANAGHNPPLLRRKNGTYEYLQMDPGFILAGLDGIEYENFHLTLQAGDALFLYTDGVTEALDLNQQLYGENRLRDALNTETGRNASVETLLPYIRAELDAFAQGAEQADDITMLGLAYHGPEIGGEV